MAVDFLGRFRKIQQLLAKSRNRTRKYLNLWSVSQVGSIAERIRGRKSMHIWGKWPERSLDCHSCYCPHTRCTLDNYQQSNNRGEHNFPNLMIIFEMRDIYFPPNTRNNYIVKTKKIRIRLRSNCLVPFEWKILLLWPEVRLAYLNNEHVSQGVIVG